MDTSENVSDVSSSLYSYIRIISSWLGTISGEVLCGELAASRTLSLDDKGDPSPWMGSGDGD